MWTAALGERPPGKIPFLGVELTDGRTVHGPLHAITIDSRPDAPRAIALKRPIYLTLSDGTWEELPFDRFVINERKITAVTVVHQPVQQAGLSA